MKFNSKTSLSTRIINRAGGDAYVESPKLAFVSLLLTSFVKDQYYRSGNESLEEVSTLMDQIPDKRFVAKAAIYARTKFGMRSISHAVAGEIAKKVKNEQWTKNFFDKIIYRPDDMMEILAYYYAGGSKNEPNALRKGFAKALARFDEYSLGKYKKDGAEVSLIDIVNLVHPKSTPAISKLIKGTLKTPETWETKLTSAGQKASSEEDKEERKKEAWTSLIGERKIGYFALLRNLRNILQQAPEMVDQACGLLIDENLIQKSLVLPFRYVTAIDEIVQVGNENTANIRKILVAINKAVDISMVNVPKFDGDTLVVLDISGSMQGQPLKIGALFATALVKSNNADFMMFSDHAKYINLNPLDSTLSITAQIEKDGTMGGGTDFHCIFPAINKKYDRIVILSDMQGWMGDGTPMPVFEE